MCQGSRTEKEEEEGEEGKEGEEGEKEEEEGKVICPSYMSKYSRAQGSGSQSPVTLRNCRLEPAKTFRQAGI